MGKQVKILAESKMNNTVGQARLAELLAKYANEGWVIITSHGNESYACVILQREVEDESGEPETDKESSRSGIHF
jgi:hypothetical protein